MAGGGGMRSFISLTKFAELRCSRHHSKRRTTPAMAVTVATMTNPSKRRSDAIKVVERVTTNVKAIGRRNRAKFKKREPEDPRDKVSNSCSYTV
jgi:hypothetical protein